MLQQECVQAGVEINVDCTVNEIQRNEGFDIKTTVGDFSTESLVIASGGISIPKWAQQILDIRLLNNSD